MDDTVVMNNGDDKVEVEEPLVEEVDVDTYEMEEQIEVEAESSTTGRPKRQCVGAGVERLEMSLDNSKEYAYVKENKYSFNMNSTDHPFIRGNKSFMSVAANVLFTQVNEHA